MKIKIIVSTLLASVCVYAQVPVGSPPTPYPATNAVQTQNLANRAWYRGGNALGGPGGANNIFGTAAGFNSAIFTQTNGKTRTRLNGDASYAVGNPSVNDNRNGFMLLTNNPTIWTGGFH